MKKNKVLHIGEPNWFATVLWATSVYVDTWLNQLKAASVFLQGVSRTLKNLIKSQPIQTNWVDIYWASSVPFENSNSSQI